MYTENITDQYYEIRQSSVLLIVRLLGVELGMLLLHFLVGKGLAAMNMYEVVLGGMSLEARELIIFHVTNSVLLLSIILSWLYTYYVISGHILSSMKGVINKEKKSFDLIGVQEIRVTQSLFGQIGKYGTICLENPLLGETIMLKDIGTPERYEKYLEKKRQTLTKNMPNTVVVSSSV